MELVSDIVSRIDPNESFTLFFSLILIVGIWSAAKFFAGQITVWLQHDTETKNKIAEAMTTIASTNQELCGDVKHVTRAIDRQDYEALLARISELVRWTKTCAVALVNLKMMIISHDATVHGVNPSLGKDISESARIAVIKYEDIIQQLQAFKKAIEEAL